MSKYASLFLVLQPGRYYFKWVANLKVEQPGKAIVCDAPQHQLQVDGVLERKHKWLISMCETCTNYHCKR